MLGKEPCSTTAAPKRVWPGADIVWKLESLVQSESAQVEGNLSGSLLSPSKHHRLDYARSTAVITTLSSSMEVAATSNAAITPHATIGELPRQELDFDETDCSNPQQGPGSAASRLGSTCMAQSPPTTSVGVVPGRVTSPLTTGESDDRSAATKRSAQEDDVGRHQAASCEARAAVRFSATMKDNRKLFVGGLPMDGTF